MTVSSSRLDIEDDLAEQASDIVTLIDCPSPDDCLEIHSAQRCNTALSQRLGGLGLGPEPRT